MSAENNVAAQAGDSLKGTGDQPGLYRDWPSAQAGDEPMLAAEAAFTVFHNDRKKFGLSALADKSGFIAGHLAARVSPRATADVERVTITPALRRAVDMTRADLGESGSNYPAVRELLAFAESHIATTKPGA